MNSPATPDVQRALSRQSVHEGWVPARGASVAPPSGAAFRVWAPNARRVDVLAGGRRHPLAAREAGLFEGSLSGVRAGHDYAYSLDGGRPLQIGRAHV